MWELEAILSAAKSLPDVLEGGRGVAGVARRLFKGRRVVFTGMAGVGKTVLFDHLRGAHLKPGYAPSGPSLKREKGRVKARTKRAMAIVVPGDISAPRLEALDEVFKPGMPDVFIHCVANGFTTVRHGFRPKLAATHDDPVEEFRSRQVEAEVRDLRELALRIEAESLKDPSPFAFLVAVTKADLYIADLAAAALRYAPGASSAFVAEVASLSNRVGTLRMRWDACPVASWIESFQLGDQTAPSQISAAHRDDMLAVFAHTLGRLIDAS